jgi:glycosyltransferase involved in cell wall biosynthesis
MPAIGTRNAALIKRETGDAFARRVLVIIPAYNEALSLPALLTQLLACCPSLDVLVVDDGSTDQTASVISEFPVRLISLPCNLGVGGAIQTGLLVAVRENYDVAVQVDGDGQHPPSEIPKLLAAMRDSGSDMILGSRFLGGDGYRSTLGRRAGIQFFSSILSLLCGTRITDATSGFRAWNRAAIQVLAKEYPEDYPEVEAILLLHHANLRISETPVRMLERTAGQSSIRVLQAVTYMIKVPLAIFMNLLRRRKPQLSD